MGHGERGREARGIAVAARGVGDARKVEWDVGMLRRAGRDGRMAQPVREDSGGQTSVVELVGQRLVEHEVWDWLEDAGFEDLDADEVLKIKIHGLDELLLKRRSRVIRRWRLIAAP